MSDIIEAPWTADQVKSLNDYQSAGVFHEYTCSGEHDEPLLATEAGWVCVHPGCLYIQVWAHRWTTNGSWKEMTLENLMAGEA